MRFYLIRLETQGKIIGPWNIVHSGLQKYGVIRSEKLNKYPKYDAYLLDRAKDMTKSLDHVI